MDNTIVVTSAHAHAGKTDAAVEDNRNKRKQYSRLFMTALINLAFLVLGLSEAVRGPTLLDLQEVYGTSVEVISFIFVGGSVGSLFGSFFSGYFLDKHPDHRFLYLFVMLLAWGVLNAVFPFMGHVAALFALTFFSGFSGAAVDTGGNSLILETWRGLDGGPYMHSIHFSWSVGALLGPLMAAPFLSARSHASSILEDGLDLDGHEDPQTHVAHNATLMSAQETQTQTQTQIHILYPMLGLVSVATSIGFLLVAVRNYRRARQQRQLQTLKQQETESAGPEDSKSLSRKKKLLVASMAVFFFLYVGSEYAIGIYLTTFAVECKLQLTKVQGAEVTAVFWFAFAAIRFIAIFAAIKLNPSIIMGLSFTLCIVGGGILSFFGESSLLLLQICSGVLGFGMGSIYATGILWLEGYMDVTSRIAAVFIIAGSLGPDVFPMLIGQTITHEPMSMFYITLATVVLCVALFLLSVPIAVKVKQQTNADKMADIDREEAHRLHLDNNEACAEPKA